MAIVKKISELTPKGSNLANTDLLIVGVDNGTDYDLKSVTGAQVLGNVANGLVPYTGATTNVNLGEFEVKAGQLSLDTTPTGTATVGTTRWNDNLGSSETTLKGGSVVIKNGVDLVARVVNKVTPNTTLTKANYQVVRISGAQGQRLAVNLAQANNDNNSADTLGIVCETIATNAEGFIMTMGQLENINTTGSLQSETWVDGDVLYLSPTTAGKITNIKPTGATGHIVILGYVEYSHAVNGKIYVKVMNGWELDELHNVSISSPLDKQLLSYENSTSLWKNKTVTTADISDSSNKRYVTDANLTTIGNTSGVNTGDQDLSGYVNTTTSQSIAGEKTFSSNITLNSGLRVKHGTTNYSIGYTGIGASANSLIIGNQVGTNEYQRTLTFPTDANHAYTFPSLDGTLSLTSDLTSKVDGNTAITGATKTKITYDSKGLVTAGSDATTADIADSLNKRYVTDANLTVIGNTSGTNTGDQIISDATLTTSDITTNNVSITKHGFVPKAPNNTTQFLRGDGTWGTPSGGTSGIWGIANSSGVYTYYATWALAVAAAVSGQVIELFADITEATNTYILKNGVNVNGNGHTITFSNAGNGFDDNNVACTVVFSSITLVKTTGSAIIQCFNASSNIGGYSAILNITNAGGYGFFGSGTIWGFTTYGSGFNILTRFGTTLNITNCYINGAVSGNSGTVVISNCYIKGEISGSPSMNNCTVISTGGVAYTGNGKNITNCSFVSMTSNVIVGGGIFENCYIYSAAERPLSTDVNAQFNNCYIESATLYINQYGVSCGSFYNCTLKVKLSHLFYGSSPKLYNCTLINEWNTTGVYVFRECSNVVEVNNYIQVANSGTIINYTASTQTVYMYGNAIKGTTNINSAGITNAQTNTADAQGNVILQ